MLKKIFAFGAALIVGGTLAIADPIPPPTIDPTFAIVTVDPKTKEVRSGCTGFYIADGIGVTAGHCIGGRQSLKVQWSDGSISNATVGITSIPDFGFKDFAVLRIIGWNTKALTKYEVNCNYRPAVGDPVTMTGFPMDIGRLTVSGLVTSNEIRPWSPYWYYPVVRYNMASAPGFSGSGVLSNGKVIAIHVGSLPENRTLNVGNPISDVCKVLDLG